jgi:type I restriction enzyme S subunit
MTDSQFMRSHHHNDSDFSAVHYLKFNNGENQTNLRKDDVLSCPVPLISFKEQNLFITEYNKFNKLKKEILEINFEKFNLIKNVNNILIHKNTNNE